MNAKSRFNWFVPPCVVFVMLCFCLAVVSCGNEGRSEQRQNTLSKIQSTKKLKVGYIIFPPAVTRDANTGELGGHHVATIREIAQLSNWELEFVEADWATFSAGLNSGRFDLSIAPTFVTVPRANSVAFTRPLFYAGNSAIVRRDDDRFTTIDSFDRPGIKLAVTQGEAGHEYAKAHFKHTELIVHSGPSQIMAFQDVLTGRADAALGDAFMTAKFALEHPDRVRDHFADSPYNLTPVSWAVRHGDHTLLTFINNCLEALDSQGTLREFEQAAGANWLHIKRTWELGTQP